MVQQLAAAPTPFVDDAELTDALLIASRALVAVAARSLAQVDLTVTLPQYRALVVLSARGPISVGALAEELGIHASSASRLCSRLVAKRLVRRTTVRGDRREASLSLTAAGRRLVDRVLALRRREIADIAARIPAELRRPAVDALAAFCDAAGEAPQTAWAAGWEPTR